jgi:hypothetical protein
MSTFLQRLFNIQEKYTIGTKEQTIGDAWIAEWQDKPTVGVVRGARAEVEEKDKRIEELEDLLRPFAEAYRLHLRDDKRVTQLKIAMSMNTSVEDWRAAFVELYGEPVQEDQQEVM